MADDDAHQDPGPDAPPVVWEVPGRAPGGSSGRAAEIGPGRDPSGAPRDVPYGATPWTEDGAFAPGQRGPYPPVPFGGGAPYGPAAYPPGGYYVPQVRNRNATIALTCGLVSLVLCGFACIPAIIYGKKARTEIATSHGTQSGDGVALAGLIIGYVVGAFYVAMITLSIVLAVIGAFNAPAPR